jgi:hypothetical protein
MGWAFTIFEKMNFRRGFLRLWIVATGIWIAGWAWHYAAICRDSDGVVYISGFNCSPRERQAEMAAFLASKPSGGFTIGPPILEIGATEIGITLVGIPLGILAMSLLAAWVIRGFRE